MDLIRLSARRNLIVSPLGNEKATHPLSLFRQHLSPRTQCLSVHGVYNDISAEDILQDIGHLALA